MANATHNVIIGNGSAGNGAAITLRERDPDSRITIITMGGLPFYNRYDLPRVFRGCQDWREILVHPLAYYDDNRITLRRNSRVTDVDGRSRSITFAHNEVMQYDQLLVCAGGRGYLPEELSDYKGLMHSFHSFEAAMTTYRALPKDGTAVMLGGDMIGLDLARTLVDVGYRVVLLANEYTFWPHRIDTDERGGFIAALEHMGIEVVDDVRPVAVEEGAAGKPARRIVFEDGGKLDGNVVIPFYGLVPTAEFMLGSGVDIERGLLVDPQLHTTDANIWAAGDVCQIWSAADNAYRFYYGWSNVRQMGEVAARNVTGATEAFEGVGDERLHIGKDGRIESPFWEY
ncbi:MAG: FAD-dependent oxidoreductase [Alphaproteobacteria bacterium]|nr:FAD-dependent oxidoreductase [Alphaproteobacteria bacterium]